MTPAKLSTALLSKGLKHINAAMVRAWTDDDRAESEAWLNGGPVPEWLYGFDEAGVLEERVSVPKEEKPKQRSLFE